MGLAGIFGPWCIGPRDTLSFVTWPVALPASSPPHGRAGPLMRTDPRLREPHFLCPAVASASLLSPSWARPGRAQPRSAHLPPLCARAAHRPGRDDRFLQAFRTFGLSPRGDSFHITSFVTYVRTHPSPKAWPSGKQLQQTQPGSHLNVSFLSCLTDPGV